MSNRPGSDYLHVFEHNGAGDGRVGGFTLLELLVVIAIIAVLTSYVAPRFLGTVGKSEIQTARVQLRALSQALDAFRLDVGRYPTQSEGLEALVNPPESDTRWRGPYLRKSIPMDPWGTPYQYSPPATAEEDLVILSWGADRKPSGRGDGVDIHQ